MLQYTRAMRRDTPVIGVTVGSGELWKPTGTDYLPYAAVPEMGGGIPLYLGLGDAARLDECDGLLLSGGRDIHPDLYDRMPGDKGLDAETMIAKYDMTRDVERDDYEFEVLRCALDRGMPVLGICRGIQTLNVFLGQKLIPDIPKCVPNALAHRGDWGGVGPSHDVQVQLGSVIHRAYGCENLLVNSYHHQGLSEDMLAPKLTATAMASDGVVEAVEGIDWPFVVAVQWHPERARDPYIHEKSKTLFRAFVDACRA